MSWLPSALESLERQPICGYAHDQPPATEPTALAALALAGASLHEPASSAAEWLADVQSPDGSVGVRPHAPRPRWPTALAVLAWQRATREPGQFKTQIEMANAWSLAIYGERSEPNGHMGHQTMLSAWPWVEGTHSWIEPTAMQVLALKASGHTEHPRTREAVELLIDRQLPDGGCNFGNTTVLGKIVPPYVQSTGIAMMALAGEDDPSGRIERSLDYLAETVLEQTTPASLGWGLMGLAAHNRRPPDADASLQNVATRSRKRPLTPIHTALLVLASQADKCPLVPPFPASNA